MNIVDCLKFCNIFALYLFVTQCVFCVFLFGASSLITFTILKAISTLRSLRAYVS
jgi:uncharacterized membrane protein